MITDWLFTQLKMRKKQPKQPHNQKSKEKPKDKTVSAESNETEDRIDFGGLPDRNLKKNLGCGG